MSQRNNVNKKSTNGNNTLSLLSRAEKQMLMSEMRKGLGPMPKNGKQRSRRNGGQLVSGGDLKFAPTAKTRTVRSTVAQIATGKNGDCHVTHREFIRDIAGSVGFANTQLAINPGQASVFPWLSKIAKNFESYRFRALRFLFETESATTASGTILFAVDYDASDEAPVNKQQAMAYRGSVRTAPWSSCVHTSRAEDLSKLKTHYVRSGNQPVNTDIKTYDVGNLNVSTIGQSGIGTIGELYVEYSVDLLTPEFFNDAIVGGSVVGGGTQSAANPIGTVPVPDAQNAGFSVDGASIVTFQQIGDYVLTYSFVGTVITAVPNVITLGSGVTAINAPLGLIDGAATGAMLRQELRVSSLTNATVDVTLSATTITAARLDVAIVALNSLG